MKCFALLAVFALLMCAGVEETQAWYYPYSMYGMGGLGGMYGGYGMGGMYGGLGGMYGGLGGMYGGYGGYYPYVGLESLLFHWVKK